MLLSIYYSCFQAQQLLVATLENNGLPLIEGLSPSDPDIDLLAPLASLMSGIYLSKGWSKYNFLIESAA